MRVKQRWRGCGCSGHEGPLVASSRPSPERRLALPPHPRLTSPLSVLNTAGRRDRRVNIHQMFQLALAGLILSLAHFQNDFSSSLSKFKCLETFTLVQWCCFQDTLSIILGLVRNSLLKKRSLGDARRFQCVWPSEESFFDVQRGCTAVLSTVEMSWRASGRKTTNVLFS